MGAFLLIPATKDNSLLTSTPSPNKPIREVVTVFAGVAGTQDGQPSFGFPYALWVPGVGPLRLQTNTITNETP